MKRLNKDRMNTEVNILIYKKKEWGGAYNRHWFLEFQIPVGYKK